MKCYFHPKKDAVGLCSVCYKAVCKDCVGDDTPEIICKTCMRKGVQMLKQGNQRSRNDYNSEDRREQIISNTMKNEPAQRIPQRQYNTSNSSGPGLLQRIFKSKKNLSESNTISAEIITPVLFVGIIAGILCGIPLLSLLFFIIMPIAGIVSIIYLRSEDNYLVYIGSKKGFIVGALTGVVAAISSLILIILLEAFIGAQSYGVITSIFGFLDGSILNIIIALAGADVALSVNIIILRLLITLITFPLLGGIFGYLSARFLR